MGGLTKIQIAFKPEAKESDIEKVLGQYKNEKLLDLEYNPQSCREEQLLSRIYILKIPKKDKELIINYIKTEYSSIVEYVENLPKRKLI